MNYDSEIKKQVTGQTFEISLLLDIVLIRQRVSH